MVLQDRVDGRQQLRRLTAGLLDMVDAFIQGGHPLIVPTPHHLTVIPRRGHWSRQLVLDGIDRTLGRGQAPHLQRWFRGLADIMRR